MADINNAFLNNQRAEKVCFKAGNEFKSCEGIWVIIIRALYVLKSARAPFRVHLANTVQTMLFKQTFPDHDVWMQKKCFPLPQELNDSTGSGTGTDTAAFQLVPNPSNSNPTPDTPYYEYICTWVDDLLTVLQYATAIM